MTDLTLVVRTTDTRDDGPDHFLLHLSLDNVLNLLRLRDAYTILKLAKFNPWHVEFGASYGYWGRVAGFEADRGGQWAVAPFTTKITQPESVELETVKADDMGLVFSATWKNDDSGFYFESPLLPWEVLEKLRAGKPHGLPAAKLDERENRASKGTYRDETGDLCVDGKDEDEEDEDDERDG